MVAKEACTMCTKLPLEKGARPAVRADWRFIFALLWQKRLDLKAWKTFLQSIHEGTIDVREVVMISEGVSKHGITANEAEAMLNELLAA